MKFTILACLLAVLALGSAHAQTPAEPALGKVRYMAGLGVTAGGDPLASATYANGGGSVDIKAGGGVVFVAGVDYRVTPQFSFQGTLGFHVDDTTASNGSIKFQRFPIELLGYYHPAQNFRVGGGLRYVASPRLNSSGVASFPNVEFDNTISPIVEVEYFFNPAMAVKLRYVKEEYKLTNSNFKVDGSHFGIFGSFYF